MDNFTELLNSFSDRIRDAINESNLHPSIVKLVLTNYVEQITIQEVGMVAQKGEAHELCDNGNPEGN